MKLTLCLLLLLSAVQIQAQNNPIASITISLPPNPDANIANWKGGTSMLTISAMARAVNGRPDVRVEDSKVLVMIKRSGGKVCGNFTSGSAPAANFTALNKVWSGNNAVALLGQECSLPSGDYELTVQLFGNGPRGLEPISEEKSKAFTIRGNEQQSYQPPQPISPVNNSVIKEVELKKPMTFRWTPVVPRPQDKVTYRLKVWQLMEGQTGVQAMKTNQPVITRDVDNLTQSIVNNLISEPCRPPLKCEFIWNVQALNRDGKPIGGNNGTSEAFTITVQPVNDAPVAIKLVSPENGETVRSQNPTFSWTLTPGDVNGDGYYKIKIVEIKGDESPEQAFKGNKPFFEKDSCKPLSFQYPSSAPKLQPGKRYAWNVQALNRDGKPIGLNNGTSETFSFTVPPVVANGGRLSLISPANGETVRVQNPTFAWKLDPTPADYDGDGYYKIKIVEIKGDESPDNAIRTNKPFFEKDSLKEQSFSGVSFKPGNYAWQVQTSKATSSSVFVFTVQINSSDKIGIELLAPSGKIEPVNTRPTFEWKVGSALQNVSYAVILREIEEGKNIHDGKIVFDKKGITGNRFPFPNEVKALDSTKTYSWELKVFDANGKIISEGNVAVFMMMPPPPPACSLLFLAYQPYVFGGDNKFCEGGADAPTGANVVFLGGGTSTLLNWSLTDGSGNTTSGTHTGSSSYAITIPISFSPPPSAPGIYNYSLTVTRGSCTKTINFNAIIYPNLTGQILDHPSGNTITKLCYGEDAVLRMDGIPQNCTVLWEFSTNGGSSWNSLPGGGMGNPYNTNPVNWFTCTGPSRTIHFRGTLQNCGTNFPAPWPSGCSEKVILPLQITCPSVAGNITASSSTHTIQSGNKICSNNNYPVQVSLVLNGYIGTITGWTRNPGSIPNNTSSAIADLITSAGTYTYEATVQNGDCAAKKAQITIIVEDPIVASISSSATEVCWGDDASLTLTHNGPPGTQVQWQYSINCTGPWINSGVISVVQNTNELFGPSFPGVIPPTVVPCNPNKICWRAIVTSPTGICSPVVTSPVTIDVIVKLTPPVIVPAGPITKCPDVPVTLTTTTPVCGTSPIIYQWYLNGLPVGTGTSFPATEPGNYFVVAHNKNNCDSIQSANVVTVRDCITKVVIQGPCTCIPNTSLTLTANASSFVLPSGTTPANCGGPFTYLWSTGATTQSINLGCPLQTTTVWVEVTNPMGCVTKVFHTIKKCI
jgi:hypothetical protein